MKKYLISFAAGLLLASVMPLLPALTAADAADGNPVAAPGTPSPTTQNQVMAMPMCCCMGMMPMMMNTGTSGVAPNPSQTQGPMMPMMRGMRPMMDRMPMMMGNATTQIANPPSGMMDRMGASGNATATETPPKRGDAPAPSHDYH